MKSIVEKFSSNNSHISYKSMEGFSTYPGNICTDVDRRSNNIQFKFEGAVYKLLQVH